VKRIISSAILIALSVGFNGCTIKYPTVKHDDTNQPINKIIHHPLLNVINNVDIGSNLYSKSYLFYDDTFNITLLESINEKSVNYNVNKKPKLTTILYTWNEPYGNTMCTIRAKLDKDWKVCLTDKNNTGSFTHIGNYMYGNYYKLNQPSKYKITPSDPIFNNESFKYVALYQGKIGNKIRISFREFINNMARPAFTQDIEYELEKDGITIIGFKGLRIEIIKVTNMNITYKVIKDYK